MLEPFNRSRENSGFDTFSGFVRVDENDGNMAEIGDLSTTIDYEDYLEKLRKSRKEFSINHLKNMK